MITVTVSAVAPFRDDREEMSMGHLLKFRRPLLLCLSVFAASIMTNCTFQPALSENVDNWPNFTISGEHIAEAHQSASPGSNQVPVGNDAASSEVEKSSFYIFGLVGHVNPHRIPELPEGQGPVQCVYTCNRGNGKVYFGAGIGYAVGPYLTFEGDFSGFDSYYSPPNISPPPQGELYYTEITRAGFSLSVKAVYPVWKLRPYCGAGIALFQSELRVAAAVPSASNPEQEYDYIVKKTNTVGYQLLLGTNVMIAEHHSLGIELRKLYLKEDFGPIINGQVDIGGDVTAITYRYFF